MREKKERAGYPFRKKIIIVALVFFFSVLLLSSFFGKKGLIEIYRAQKVQKELLQEVERLEKKIRTAKTRLFMMKKARSKADAKGRYKRRRTGIDANEEKRYKQKLKALREL